MRTPRSEATSAAIMHTDASLMPKRRAVWSSWNYAAATVDGARALSVTYWMNRLQGIDMRKPVFVTLNPAREIPADKIIHAETFAHPLFNVDAMKTQKRLWALQGSRRAWFCGAYFGAGFHEDGLQAGLAVAEALGDCRRPWSVEGESDRVFLPRNSEDWALA